LNQQSQDLHPCWNKAKVIAEIIGLILIPLLIFYFAQADRKAETDKVIGVQYVKISVEILREDPARQTKELREWALSTFKEYSPIKLSPTFMEELRIKPLPISVSYSPKGGAVAGGSADVKFGHAPDDSSH